MRYAARTWLLAIAPAIAGFGCASIWGFHDAKDFADANVGESGGPEAGAPDALAGEGCVCVPTPSGWEGPFAILHPDAGTGSSCTAPYPNPSYNAGVSDAGAATCECACDAPTGMRCGVVHTYYPDAQCQQKYCARSTLSDGGCSPISTCAKPAYFTLSEPSVSGGQCTPIATVDASTPSWTLQAVLCAASDVTTGTECPVTEACLPRAQAPFDDDTYCITKLGALPCPTGFNRFVYDEGTGVDSRGCSACTCGPPSGAECGGSVTTYADSTCGGIGTTVEPPVLCAEVSASSLTATLTLPEGGSCAPSGGQPTGAFTPTVSTICCAVTTAP